MNSEKIKHTGISLIWGYGIALIVLGLLLGTIPLFSRKMLIVLPVGALLSYLHYTNFAIFSNGSGDKGV